MIGGTVIVAEISSCDRHGTFRQNPVCRYTRREMATFLRKQGYRKLHDDGTWWNPISKTTAKVTSAALATSFAGGGRSS